MAFVLGLDAKAYYGTAGSSATNEMTNVTDVTMTLDRAEADTTTRAAAGWRSTATTLKDGSVSFDMLWDDADAGFTAIKDAWDNGTAIALKFLDGAGGQGLDADFMVASFTVTQPLEEAIKVSVSVKPTASLRAPSWVGG